MSTHQSFLSWDRGDAPYSDGKYSRLHKVYFDGGAAFTGAPAPSSVPAGFTDPAAIDPEEMLLAALNSCHMLWFLDIARRAGFIIDNYAATASGDLGMIEAKGAEGFTAITIAPTISFNSTGPDGATLAALHDKAHHKCYIGNSLACPVTILAQS